MKVLALCCTHGRHSCLERSLRMFLDQDYEGKHAMLIFNSGETQMVPLLSELKDYPNKEIHIVNIPWEDIKSVGDKYNQAINYWAKEIRPNIVTSWDDDDIFLPNHISEGVKGMTKAFKNNMYAYKPQKSYYRDRNGIALVENTLEPSIFVDAEWLKAMGYRPVNVRYHQQWLDPLIGRKKILVDPTGFPTLVYNWGSEQPIHKMSGTGDDGPNNLYLHKAFSRDEGDGIVTPVSHEEIQPYYDEIKNVK